MSVSALITFTQGITSTDPGVAMLGSTGSPVLVANGNDSGVVQWTFELVGAPPSSSLTPGVVQVGTIPTFEFTPDVPGGYLWRLTVQDNNGFFAEDFRAFQTLETSGRIIAPFKGTDNSLNFFRGPTQNEFGWANFQGDYDRAVDGLSAGSGITSIQGQGGPAITVTTQDGLNVSVPLSNTLKFRINFASEQQGSTVYRGPTDWQVLDPGPTGQFLQTQGVGANPVWAPVTGFLTSIGGLTGPVITLSNGDGVAVTNPSTNNLTFNFNLSGQANGDIPCRVSGAWVPVHGSTAGRALISNGSSVAPSWQTITGFLTSINAQTGPTLTLGTGDGVSFTLAGTNVLDGNLFIPSQANGDMICRVSSAWARVPGGTSGQVLTSNGASVAPTWQTASSGGITSINSQSGPTITLATGDGVSFTSGGTNIVDGNISIPSQANGDLIVRSGGAWSRVPGGTTNFVLTSNGSSSAPTWQATQSPSPIQTLVRLFATTINPAGASGSYNFLVYTANQSTNAPGPMTILTQIYIKYTTAIVPAATTTIDLQAGNSSGSSSVITGNTFINGTFTPVGTTIGHTDPTHLNTGGDVVTGTYIVPMVFGYTLWVRLTITATAGPVTAGAVGIFGFGYILF